ncbi:hypothetical protein OSTOST_01511, partial [Ostertagia ostertagi]
MTPEQRAIDRDLRNRAYELNRDEHNGERVFVVYKGKIVKASEIQHMKSSQPKNCRCSGNDCNPMSSFFSTFSAYIPMLGHLPGILRSTIYFFTETWLKSHHFVPAMLSKWIEEYAIVRCDRSRRAGGGVAMFIRKTLNYSTVISESYEILAADVALPDLCVRIVLIYRPPSCPPTSNEQLGKVIGCGMNLTGYNGITAEISLIHSLILLQLTDSNNMTISLLESPIIGLSDHCCVSFSVSGRIVPCAPVFRRFFSKCNYSLISNYLFNIQWIPSFELVPTVDEKYAMFIAILRHTIDLFVPLHTHPDQRQSLALSTEYDGPQGFLQYAKRSGDWTEYKAFSAKFSEKLIKYNRNFVANHCLQDLKLDGRLLVNDLEKANALALEFDKVFQKDNNSFPPFSPHIANHMLTFPYFDANDIYELLRKCPCSSSITLDQVPFEFIKNVAHAIAFPLSYLFNQSIMFSQVPSLWNTPNLTYLKN